MKIKIYVINLPIALNIFQREKDMKTNPYENGTVCYPTHSVHYACIKYLLLHSHTEASKRRHEFSCVT